MSMEAKLPETRKMKIEPAMREMPATISIPGSHLWVSLLTRGWKTMLMTYPPATRRPICRMENPKAISIAGNREATRKIELSLTK